MYRSYEQRVLEIEASYTKEEEVNDLKHQKYLKNNYERAYGLLKGYLSDKCPESWKGNFIKIAKLK